MEDNSISSAIGNRSPSTNRKRKEPADDDRDLRGFFSERIFLNSDDDGVPIPILIRNLFTIMSMDYYPSFFTRYSFKIMYGVQLYQIVNTIEKHGGPIREKICGKIWDEFSDYFYDNVSSEPEQQALLYSLRAYPNFLVWLNEMEETVTDCRGKAIRHMLEELLNSSSIQDDDCPWRERRRVYDSPEKLFCKLRPYSSFLKWLQEEEEDDKWLDYNGPFIDEMLKHFRGEDFVAWVGVQEVLDGVHFLLKMLQNEHNKQVPAAEKKQEPAKKKEKNNQNSTANPNTLNPILHGLSKDDRKLLKGFHNKYPSISLLVFDEYHKYHKQLMESKGFDFDTYPGSFNSITPIQPVGLFNSQLGNIDFNKLAEFAANEKYGKGKIKFEKVVRVNLSRNLYARCYYLTFLGLYEKSPYHFKALVQGNLNSVTCKEAYEVVSFSRESTELDKRVTRTSAKSKSHILTSELKVDKPKATRRSSRSITQGSGSKGTKEKVSECEYSNHNCEKHREDLSLINSFIDMPEHDLLQKIRGSTNAPPIEELRKYFKEVSESEGFHIGKYPGFFPIVTSIIKPVKWALWGLGCSPVEKLAELAIESYNNENRSRFGFDSITEVNVSDRMHYHFYITFLAQTGDVAAAAAETFQALVLVNMALRRNYQVHFCRIAAK